MSHAELHRLVVCDGYAGWRVQALRALAAHWAPEMLSWIEGAPGARAAGQIELGYSADPAPADTRLTSQPGAALPATSTLRISRAMSELLAKAAQYRWPGRWALMYRALWRWAHGDRAVASAADEDGAKLHAMAKAVRRCHHDMIAYVRFHRSERAGLPQYLAWYEPEHDVLADAAEHFARRMGNASWCVGTPHGLALWDGQSLTLTDAPGDAQDLQADAAADNVQALWQLYYKSTFNPARLNETALEQRMPVRFWKGLPEASLIPSMIAEARQGARQLGQASGIRIMRGKPVVVDAERAQPQRPTATTLEQCRRCELWRNATQVVPGQGSETACLMLVGEQPGDHEDLAGRVFVGPAGQVLDEALHRAGVARDTLYLTNAVKHFKWEARGKRRLHKSPAQREVEACAHWLNDEIERVRPAVIVTLGATALTAVLGRKASLQAHMAEPLRMGHAWLLATWHPSYALRVEEAAARERVVSQIAHAIARGQQLASGR